MSNRVFLNFTNFNKMPKHEQLEEFMEQSSKNFEANCAIPLFWLFLFDINDLETSQDEEEEENYLYLITQKELAVLRLKKRRVFIESILDDSQVKLYDYWLKKIENNPYYRIIVRTEELSWFYEDKEFLEELTSAIKQIDLCVKHNQDLFEEDFFNLTGLLGIEKWEDCKEESLAGVYISEDGTWPKDIKEYPEDFNKKKWWLFWK